MRKVTVTKSADKVLDRIQPKVAGRIDARIRQIAMFGPDQDPQVKALTGDWQGHYRLRVGDWRVIFRLDDSELAVLRVAPRGGAYD